jgi:hypothetical protein
MSVYRVGHCEICAGWGREPGPPQPVVTAADIMPAVLRALEPLKAILAPQNTIDIKPIEVKLMKLFVSHATLDEALGTKFVELLQLGVGVSHEHVFYSSQKGSIPNGERFVSDIISELNSTDFVITLLSRAYFASHFLFGGSRRAALAKKAAGACDFFSVVLPPASFSDLDGIPDGVQSGSILERPSLGELPDRILDKFKIPARPSSIWDPEARQPFSVPIGDEGNPSPSGEAKVGEVGRRFCGHEPRGWRPALRSAVFKATTHLFK